MFYRRRGKENFPRSRRATVARDPMRDEQLQTSPKRTPNIIASLRVPSSQNPRHNAPTLQPKARAKPNRSAAAISRCVGLWPWASLRVDQSPDLRRRQRQFARLDPERGKGRTDGVGDHSADRDDAPSLAPLAPRGLIGEGYSSIGTARI